METELRRATTATDLEQAETIKDVLDTAGVISTLRGGLHDAYPGASGLGAIDVLVADDRLRPRPRRPRARVRRWPRLRPRRRRVTHRVTARRAGVASDARPPRAPAPPTPRHARRRRPAAAPAGRHHRRRPRLRAHGHPGDRRQRRRLRGAGPAARGDRSCRSSTSSSSSRSPRRRPASGCSACAS